ncbi:MAG TPA: hypothetical protein DDY98_04530 [Ruminococcaceae bacterium]|nr:hypothetical protein [Oscillospiraceae bacterium]
MKVKNKIISWLLCALVVMAMLPISAFAEDSLRFNGIKEISKYGNIKFNATVAGVLAKFDYGDILTVSFGEKSVDVPLCRNYSDVDAGCPGFFVRVDGEDEALLAISSGNFAETYGFAKKIVNLDRTFYWSYFEGFDENTVFTFSLKEKAGYLSEFTLRNISYTDARSDYPNLTDAQFANFRNITCGKIAKGVLYRSATPVQPIHNRNTYADSCCAAAGVTHFVNLAENEATLQSYEGYNNTYYSRMNHIAVAANVDFTCAETKAAFCEAFRYMAQNSGIYDVHCREGKDRSGIFAAVLECLMGADCEEICNDYMITYYNYYGITKADASYSVILNGSFVKTMNKLFDADIKTANLKKEAVEYLREIGLKPSEIVSLQVNLSENNVESVLYRVLAFVLQTVEALVNLFR